MSAGLDVDPGQGASAFLAIFDHQLCLQLLMLVWWNVNSMTRPIAPKSCYETTLSVDREAGDITCVFGKARFNRWQGENGRLCEVIECRVITNTSVWSYSRGYVCLEQRRSGRSGKARKAAQESEIDARHRNGPKTSAAHEDVDGVDRCPRSSCPRRD